MRAHLLLFIMLAAGVSAARTQQPRTVRGMVVRVDGLPLSGVNVFVLETLDGTLTDSLGRFEFQTIASPGALLVVQRIRYREQRQPLPDSGTLRIELQLAAVTLPAIHVVAGRYAIGTQANAELSSLEVVGTPGAAADVYRALQTFPGLQAVNEGAGLFVRGGDVGETRIYLNDAVVLAPYKYESPTGGFFGSFDPFLLDGIYFSSGGFGARYGDALSGIAALRTLGKPDRTSFGATASLAALSGSVALPIGSSAGARATLTRSHTELMFKLNGRTTRFTHEPEGRDASVIAAYEYGNGEVRLFAIDQWSQLGVFLDQPSFAGALQSTADHRATVLGWEHGVRRAKGSLTLGHASARKDVSFGALALTTRETIEQLRAQLEAPAGQLGTVLAGGELVRRSSAFEGRTPQHSYDNTPDALTRIIDDDVAGERAAGFIELAVTLGARLRALAGMRADHSTLTDATTVDPRLSLAYRPTALLAFTSAWGVYHQVPEPALFERHGSDLHAMRAEHRVVGAQLGADAALLLRIEAYEKRYRDLAAFNRERVVSAGGAGRTRGIDVFARWPAWRGTSGRTSYSYIHATRTDPDTRTSARSPFDITHVVSTIVDHSFGRGWQASIGRQYATGRPTTPVVAARRDSTTGLWVPEYGEPYSERLPAFSRVDAAISRLVPLPRQRLLVLFVAMNNVLDRKNVHDYQYSADYSTRTPVRSQFKRAVYFGASLHF